MIPAFALIMIGVIIVLSVPKEVPWRSEVIYSETDDE